jgi:hypothetical protein
MKRINAQKANFNQKVCKIFFFALVTSLFLLSCEPKKPINYKSTHFITAKDAVDLWKNYNAPQKTAITLPDSLNSNSAWFSIYELENYIAYAKAETKKRKIPLSGMRLYFGRYPDGLKKIGGLNTIFFSPTGKFRTKKGQVGSNSSEEDPDSQDPDLTDLNLLNFGSSGWPPYIVYPDTIRPKQ